MRRLVPILMVVFLVDLTTAFAQRSPRESRSAPPSSKVESRASAVSPKRKSTARRPGRGQIAEKQSVERVREVIDLRHTPAIDVAESINKLLRSEQPSRLDEVAVVPEPIGNRLLVSSSPAMFDRIVELIEGIDVQPKCVVIEALIAVVEREDKAADKSPLVDFDETEPSEEQVAALIEQLKKCADVELLARPMVTTIDGQPAFIQLSQRVPRAQTVVTESGTTSTVEYENVGLILGVTPRIGGDTVTMEIDLERSEVAKDGAATPTVDVSTAQATVTAKSGQAIVVGGMKVESSSSAKEVMMFVTPTILDPAPE